MEHLEEEFNESLHRIPEAFHSFSEGRPFQHCVECDKQLYASDEEYFIEKAFRKYPGYSASDVVFEYAICMTCAEKMRSQMSRHSIQQINDYIAKNTKTNRRMDLLQRFQDTPEHWIDECMVSGDRLDSVQEYQIFAHCRGEHLITDYMPYMLSGKILDEIAQILSNETLGELDDFMGRHFGPSPELAKEFPYRKMVII